MIECALYRNEFPLAYFVVPKKDEKERLVVYMRKLNGYFLEDDFAPAISITHLMAEMQSAGSQFSPHSTYSMHSSHCILRRKVKQLQPSSPIPVATYHHGEKSYGRLGI